MEGIKKPEDDWRQVVSVLDEQSGVIPSVLHNIVSQFLLPNDVKVTPAVYEDCDMESWMKFATYMRGGGEVAWAIYTHPTASIELLQMRQQAIRKLPLTTRRSVATLQPYESDILWLYSIPKLQDTPSLQVLFPRTPFIRALNLSSTALTAYHAYRGYMAPGMHFIGPLTTVFGPYIYMRRQLKMKMPLNTYFKMMWMMAKTIAKPSYDLRKDVVKLGTFMMYLTIFVLGLVQSFEVAKMVRTMRKGVLARLAAIREFVATSQALQQQVDPIIWEAFGLDKSSVSVNIPSGIRGMHALLTNDTLRQKIYQLTQRMYLLDALCTMRRRDMCFVSMTTKPIHHPVLWNMGHLQLPRKQVRNPVSLHNSLIVTGPNAGGKTTYVRSICANILLAQTFGVAYAQKASMTPYHTISSFMRVVDTLGQASLFEAEARRCAQIIHQAEEASAAGLRSIVFLDEPMHSTPPIEGAATSMATIEHLGKLPGTRVIATTHYFAITKLAKTAPEYFQNVSMEAVMKAGGFHFPYKLRNGPSYQCIALELLEDSNLPAAVISRAMEWKNKLCETEIRNDDR